MSHTSSSWLENNDWCWFDTSRNLLFHAIELSKYRARVFLNLLPLVVAKWLLLTCGHVPFQSLVRDTVVFMWPCCHVLLESLLRDTSSANSSINFLLSPLVPRGDSMGCKDDFFLKFRWVQCPLFSIVSLVSCCTAVGVQCPLYNTVNPMSLI